MTIDMIVHRFLELWGLHSFRAHRQELGLHAVLIDLFFGVLGCNELKRAMARLEGFDLQRLIGHFVARGRRGPISPRVICRDLWAHICMFLVCVRSSGANATRPTDKRTDPEVALSQLRIARSPGHCSQCSGALRGSLVDRLRSIEEDTRFYKTKHSHPLTEDRGARHRIKRASAPWIVML